MEEIQADDRRIQDRIPVSLTIDYRTLDNREALGILNGEGYDDLNGHSLALSVPRRGMQRAQAKDLSLGGACLASGEGFQVGATAALDIHLPKDPVVVKVLADVVWTCGCGDSKKAGLRFSAWGEESQKRLWEFMKGDSL